MKNKWREYLNDFQDFINKPSTKTVVAAGNQILTTVSGLNLKTKLGIATSAITILDRAVNATIDGYSSEFLADYASRKGLIAENASGHSLITLLNRHGAFADAKKLFCKGDDKVVTKSFSSGEVALCLESDKIYEFNGVFVSKELEEKELAAILWKNLGNALTLTVGENGIDIQEISDFATNEYIGSQDIQNFVDKVIKYRKAGIQRAYLLKGVPGCGKTTFSFKCAKMLGGKILVITPDVLGQRGMQYNVLVGLIASLNPDVLLFEDIDRVSNNKILLSVIDFIRQQKLDMLMLATANDESNIVDALRRPGRLGFEIKFESPTEEWTKKVIELYCKKLGVQRDITHLSEKMQHELFSHDYIKEICEQALVEDDDVLIENISKIKKSLDNIKKGKNDVFDSKEGF